MFIKSKIKTNLLKSKSLNINLKSRAQSEISPPKPQCEYSILEQIVQVVPLEEQEEPTLQAPSSNFIKLLNDKLTAQYNARHLNNEFIAVLQCTQKAKSKSLGLPFYYFEIKILEAAEETEITIGLSELGIHNKAVGKTKKSYGYHADGKLFREAVRVEKQLEKFGKDYTIGCGINYPKQSIFFTINGKFQEYAFQNIPLWYSNEINEFSDLYATVTLSKVGEKIKANFKGKEHKFLFNLEAFAKSGQQKDLQEIQAVNLQPSVTYNLIYEYLLFHGYSNTFEALENCSGQQSAAIQQPPPLPLQSVARKSSISKYKVHEYGSIPQLTQGKCPVCEKVIGSPFEQEIQEESQSNLQNQNVESTQQKELKKEQVQQQEPGSQTQKEFKAEQEDKSKNQKIEEQKTKKDEAQEIEKQSNQLKFTQETLQVKPQQQQFQLLRPLSFSPQSSSKNQKSFKMCFECIQFAKETVSMTQIDESIPMVLDGPAIFSNRNRTFSLQLECNEDDLVLASQLSNQNARPSIKIDQFTNMVSQKTNEDDLKKKSLKHRGEMQRLIQEGRIQEAINYLNTNLPEVIIENQQVAVQLYCQNFIELIRSGCVFEALEFAQLNLQNYKSRRFYTIQSKLKGTGDVSVSEVMGLLCYIEPEKSQLAFLLDCLQREVTAELVNISILDKIYEERSQLENALTQLVGVVKTNRECYGNQQMESIKLISNS